MEIGFGGGHRVAIAASPAPVVVWSHGGASGENDPTDVVVEYGQVFVEAGYANVAIAHTPRNGSEYAALCSALSLAAIGQATRSLAN